MEFRLLGPLEVRAGGRVLALGGAKQRAVLALLLLHANEVVSSDRLIDELWGVRPPKTAQTTLQVYVSRLRKALPAGVLERRAPGYLVALEPGQLDLHRCEALLHEGRQALQDSEPERALERLQEALGLWRGPPLADFAFASFTQAAIGRLEELRLACLEERIEAELQLGRHPELAGELEQLIAQQPLRERLHAQRMLALYRAGRQAEALAAYQQARTLLVEELGIEPSPALQQLEKQILTQDETLEWKPPGEPEPPPTNLPAPATPLIGRERELAEAGALLRAHRLLTLTGAGGSGKTRLAFELAALANDQFPDGAWFVNLAPIADADLVIPTIAQTLGLPPAPGASIEQTLAAYLSTRELLLVLDNFEQVVEAAAGIAQLLAGSATLKLLVTSREPLHLQGEHEYAVPPLARSEAVALFFERARAVKPGFEPTDADAATAAEICLRLDGLPLALELAAARAKVLSPQAMLERLERRLPLLTGGARDLPERQRTLSATIDWSFQLLEEQERRLYARLGVFVGGCTMETAEAVCKAELDDLASLVDKSLLHREGERFTMLETIREHALEQLEASGEAEEQRRRHAEHYLDLAERVEPELRGPEQRAWLDRLEAELPNIRSCLAWGLEQEDAELPLRLASALWDFLHDRAQALIGEEIRWLERPLARAASVPAPIRAKALRTLGSALFVQGRYEAAARAEEEALALSRELGDENGTAGILNRLGRYAWAIGDMERAQTLQEEALASFKRLGDRRDEAFSLQHLGEIARDRSDFRRSAELLEECIQLLRELGDHQGVAGAVHSLGDTALDEQDFARAVEHYRESLALLHGLGSKRGLGYCLAGLAGVAASREELQRAGRLWGAVEAGEEELGVRLLSVERARYERVLAPCAGDPAFEKGVAEGRSLGLAHAVEEELDAVALTP